METFYAIKDKEDCYATKHSLFKNKEGEVEYHPSKTILNGCGGYINKAVAQEHLECLLEKNNTYNYNQVWRIERIDLKNVINAESGLHNKMKII